MRTFSLHFHYQFFTFEGRSVISACFSLPYWQKGLFVTGGGWAAHSASSRAIGFVSSPPLTSQMEILDLVGFSLMPANRNTHTHFQWFHYQFYFLWWTHWFTWMYLRWLNMFFLFATKTVGSWEVSKDVQVKKCRVTWPRPALCGGAARAFQRCHPCSPELWTRTTWEFLSREWSWKMEELEKITHLRNFVNEGLEFWNTFCSMPWCTGCEEMALGT